VLAETLKEQPTTTTKMYQMRLELYLKSTPTNGVATEREKESTRTLMHPFHRTRIPF